MRPLVAAAIAPLAIATLATSSGAQATVQPTAPRTIVGVVVDTSGTPIPGAEVFYGDNRVRVVAGADGAFRFTGVRRGDYTVTVRRVGYLPQSRELSVPDSGATIRFVLIRLATTLAPAVTTVRQSGFAGTVTDSAFHPLAGVLVEAAGGTAGHVETDSSGHFQINAGEGHYFLRVSRDGYRTVSTSLSVGRDEGRTVNFRLIPDATYSLIRERLAAFQMRQRLALRRPSRSRVYTRDDIAKFGARNLDDLIRRSGLSGSACIAVMNGLEQVPTWAVELADIEYLELYEGGGGTSVPRARAGDTPQMPGFRRDCSVTAFVWVRR